MSLDARLPPSDQRSDWRLAGSVQRFDARLVGSVQRFDKWLAGSVQRFDERLADTDFDERSRNHWSFSIFQSRKEWREPIARSACAPRAQARGA